MYTREDLATLLKVSKSTVCRLLNIIQRQPDDITYTGKHKPVYQYNQDIIEQLYAYVKEARQLGTMKNRGKQRCRGGCGRVFAKEELSKSGICRQCYIRKAANNIAFGGKPWKRILDCTAVQYAIHFLKGLLPGSVNNLPNQTTDLPNNDTDIQ